MERLLHSGENLEFFIEGSRSRSGKPCCPKAGLLSMVVDTVRKGNSIQHSPPAAGQGSGLHTETDSEGVSSQIHVHVHVHVTGRAGESEVHVHVASPGDSAIACPQGERGEGGREGGRKIGRKSSCIYMQYLTCI